MQVVRRKKSKDGQYTAPSAVLRADATDDRLCISEALLKEADGKTPLHS